MPNARLELVPPTEEYESQVMSYRAEMLENGDDFDGCAGLELVESYGEWLNFEKRLKKMYGEGYVPSEVYLAVRKSDGRVVGIIDYRTRLSDFLLNFGGSIGYSVRPSERRNGYAKEMLGLILERCRETGAEKVLLCCDKYNEASAKTIIVNGGVLENEVADTVKLTRSAKKTGDGIIQRYWINLF
ncbi:MAG: GNAT family N-acetyltransferase [Oscillospiraceae bacterium]|nr:GNAT family N-acetyltransferase [Oscillospiraceae bacterium]